MESAAFIQWCLAHLNYWTITLLMAIESSFIPFPSEVVVPPAAYRAAAPDSELNVLLIILFATIGANIGAIINYFLARWLGRPIVYAFANSRFGHVCLIDEQKVQRAERYFDEHGAIGTFLGRLVPAVRQLISIPAGLARMSLTRFLLFTTLGAGLWNTVLAVIGTTLASVVPEDELMDRVNTYSHEIGYGMIVVAIAVVAYLTYKAMRPTSPRA